LRQIPAHQGLATGKPYVVDAQPGKGRYDPLDLVEAQPVIRFLEAPEALGQAVETPQVALVDHRQAQVFHPPAERVDQARRAVVLL
jgi:hypothetical protein